MLPDFPTPSSFSHLSSSFQSISRLIENFKLLTGRDAHYKSRNSIIHHTPFPVSTLPVPHFPFAVCSFCCQWERAKNNNKPSGWLARNMAYMGLTLFLDTVSELGLPFSLTLFAHGIRFRPRLAQLWVAGEPYTRLILFLSLYSVRRLSLSHTLGNGSLSPRFIGPPTPARVD